MIGMDEKERRKIRKGANLFVHISTELKVVSARQTPAGFEADGFRSIAVRRMTRTNRRSNRSGVYHS
jgi:hypothetical protein